jgi:predicted molibdopterin-dependent oxidoreductase YjgC
VEHKGKRKNYSIDKTNPYIYRDNNKCILCGRCVSTCAKVPERAVLAFGGRGFNTTVIADNAKTMGESNCVSCGRCISVCPVGALLDSRAMNIARSWELVKEEVKCAVCEHGCHFELLKKDGRIMGVRALGASEGRPLCLKGRLTVDLTYNEDPKTPLVKKDGEFIEASWTEVLGLEKLISKL